VTTKKAVPIGVPPAVILCNPKYEHNVGGTLRACSCFDISQLWWTGHRVRIDKGRGERLPREERMRGYAAVEWTHHERPFDQFTTGTPVCVELTKSAEPLTRFEHPDDAVYVFGPEDGSVPQVVKMHCHRFVYIPARHCLNLAVAVGTVLAHRMMSRQLAGKEPVLSVGEMLNESRGYGNPKGPVSAVAGWDGK